MLDTIIRGGTIVDGTGRPQTRGDVGIADGRIVALGTVADAAETTVDADGLVVAPGFVDPHTHYDAQLFWDPTASPSSLHGVTSVIAGNCGFTLAPVRSEHAGYLQRMMAKVEGMPLAALESGLPWNWSSFADYLDRLEGRIGVNAGFLVGHCAIRREVMGEASVGEAATPEQLAAMQELLRSSIGAGGLGFSSSQAYTHDDDAGAPVPSRWATQEEVVTLASTIGEFEGTWLEFITDGCLGRFSDEEMDTMAKMSAGADRSLNWNVLSVDSKNEDRVRHQLMAAERAAAIGGRVVALTMPTQVGMNMSFGFFCAFNRLPDWGDFMTRPVPEKIAQLRDPERSRFLLERSQSPDAGVFLRLTDWATYRIGDTFAPQNQGLSGRVVGDVAAERGTTPWETLVDIVVADELRTILWPSPTDDDDASWALRAELWARDDVLIGGSDAGAHLDRMCGAPYTTEWLADCIRGRQLMTMEEAVHQMTDVPARLFGLRGRGRVQEGFFADLVLFDPDTVSSEPLRMKPDLPGDTARLYAEAIGIRQVLCNGVTIVDDGTATGAAAGTVLRAGRDTETVPASGS